MPEQDLFLEEFRFKTQAKQNVNDNETKVRIGGNETVGMGWCKVKVLDGEIK